MKCNAATGGFYGFGVIGSFVYFIQHANSVTEGIVGIVYSIFWPALLVYKVLEILKF